WWWEYEHRREFAPPARGRRAAEILLGRAPPNISTDRWLWARLSGHPPYRYGADRRKEHATGTVAMSRLAVQKILRLVELHVTTESQSWRTTRSPASGRSRTW